MDKQAFKQRMQNLKSYRENNPGKGYWDWRNSLPDNLKYTDDTEYDMVGAYNSGAQPTLEDDGSYHLPTRVPSTGKVLKSSIHPTYWKGLAEDERLGYHTYWLPDGSTYTASKYDVPIQAYQNGGRHALGVGQVFASLADMLFNKERRTPAIAAAAYHTIHQTQNDLALAPVEAPLIEPIVDAIKSVDETPYDPGEVFLLSPENQKKQMTKNPNYRVVDTNSEEDPYGIVRRAANYHKEIHGEVPVYEYIADSDTTIKRSNLIPVGTLPLGEYTPELPHAGSYNSVLYYNASNDKLYQRAYDLNDYGPTDTKDKGASSMYIGPIRWLSRQLDKAGTPFVQRTGFVPLDEGKYYNQLPESAKKKVRERRRLRNSYEYGGEVNEFQRKTRRDIMQESLVDGRPDYNKMFQNQNEYQKDFANYWYTERAKNPKYSDQIGGDKLGSVLSNIDKAVKLGEKERRMSARLNNETYETVQRLMDDPSYMRRAQQVKEKYGDDYTQIYADLIDAYNNSPELLPKAKRTAFEDNARARMATTTESTKRHMDGGEFPKMGEYEYQYDINGVPYGTTIHEMNHNADYLKNKAADADANSNLYYWMRSALKPFSRIDPNTDKLTKYYSKPTEQKAYMNQLREFMYANKMIDTRDQIVTPDLIKQAISKLPKGMQSIKKASKQFKSMRSYTKWFNTIPLLGVGAVGTNKYFTSNENRD